MMLRLYVLLVLHALLGTVYCGNKCAFPISWSRNQWLTHLMTSPINTSVLMTYHPTYAYMSTSRDPHHTIMTYVCWAYEQDTKGSSVYLSIPSSSIRELTGTCVRQRKYDDVIIRQEAPYAYHGDSFPNEILAVCEEELIKESVYHIYLPVQIHYDAQSPGWSISTRSNWPFPHLPYRVTYDTSATDRKRCADDPTSVVSVSGSHISIMACGYEDIDAPLTGTLTCLQTVSPAELGEPALPGEGVVIVEWSSRTQPGPRYYCVRYKHHNTTDQSVDLSFDLSPRSAQCQRGARADWSGDHGGRDYLAITLHYDNILLSHSVAGGVTTRLSTTTALPAAEPDPASLEHLRFSLDLPYTDSQNSELESQLIQEISSLCKIEASRCTSVIIKKGRAGKVEVTFHVTPGRPTVQTCADLLWYKISKNEVLGQTYSSHALKLVSGSVQHWTDAPPCPDEVCSSGTSCQRRQPQCRCPQWSSIDCIEDKDQAVSKADVADVADTDNKLVIIIALVVCAIVLIVITIIVIIVVMKRRRDDQSSVADSGYDGMGEIEQQDRELYSTINKKPIAYHEKYFLDGEDTDSSMHGEKTGIHINGSYM